ncbi:glycosyltransferase family 39 protein [Anabaena cylindrica UHCC 0172]|uniref:glycosyltransferase family 39 protein n=1 Tax=Anabaena cylindrica TaxID=1165 RepID=UPI002B1F662A|nr:glycosyltransferase family 39 protein [Anabaena cylindrica]MEA5552638.1 glycosyltransferase family 39 protein [Anabaena cylindrica UHCC 0172]
MTNRKLFIYDLGLAGTIPAVCIAIAIGTILRFWHLDLKPLWLDEIITAIFSLGKNYRDLPLDVLFPLNHIQEVFAFQPGVSCPQIAENLASYSTHPPLFFCWMYSWLGFLQPLGMDLVVKLRSLPALFGVATILAIYGVNRIAFSPTSGIMAALLMALSPFAVYLSQEARHYTLPMLIITLALFLLMLIQQDLFYKQKLQFWVWLLWAIINSIGLYVHYFFSIAFIAEIATLLLLIYQGRSKIFKLRQVYLYLVIFTCFILISFMPWVLVIVSHLRSSETNWLPSAHHVEPIYQTLITWVLMIITLPVENQPLLIAIFCSFLMVVFMIWAGWQVFPNLKLLWLKSTTHLPTFTLLSFTFFVLLQFFFIAYLLGKDITVVPRYHFVYYPSFCALLAASLEKVKISKFIFLLIGVISCIFVLSNLGFQKPFQPEKVAQNMNFESNVPLMLVVGYDNYQDVAGGFSFALALEQLRSHEIASQFQKDSLVFLDKNSDFSAFSNKLSQLSMADVSQFNLWFVGSSMKKRDYPPKLALTAGKTTCNIEPTQHYRTGHFPYQLYRCSNS